MHISFVWAMAENRVIGRDNTLPWRLPDDMRHFMNTTMGKPVLMGRKTFESMKSALPGRTNIVMTRDPNWHREGVKVVADLDAGIELAESQGLIDGVDEIMIIGGAEIYALALPRATRLYLTQVHAEPKGDVFFPELDLSAWELVMQKKCYADDRHSCDYTFENYQR
jgi:dihydrofolate reductase|tara:strand:- start:3440 stop:3940 length:501 start_codon:yes stop_codon:yes gene_type:complete